MKYSMRYTRPEEIQLGGARVTTRSPWALWILTFVTLGIWGIVWWYQVNRELRDVSEALEKPWHVPPVLSTVLIALWPIALIPALITLVITTIRARVVQVGLGEESQRARPLVAALLFLLVFSHTWYLQRSLNATWLHARDI